MFFAGSNRVRLAGLEDSISGVGVGLIMLERGELRGSLRGVRPTYQAERSSLHVKSFEAARVFKRLSREQRWRVEGGE